jgi:hypothetical protein
MEEAREGPVADTEKI